MSYYLAIIRKRNNNNNEYQPMLSTKTVARMQTEVQREKVKEY